MRTTRIAESKQRIIELEHLMARINDQAPEVRHLAETARSEIERNHLTQLFLSGLRGRS